MRVRVLSSFAIFLILAAIAAAVKTNALGTGGIISGWPWGGMEDNTIGGALGVIDGNETGVGWINMHEASKVDTNGNGVIDDADELLKICSAGANQFKSCNGPGAVACPGGACVEAYTLTNYGIDFPEETCAGNACDLQGYAWNENLGWIDFNPETHCVSAGVPAPGQYGAVSCTAPSGSAKVRRSGNNLTGWARIASIAEATVAGNSGGWGGWIHMNGSNYGVEVDKMDGNGGTHTYAWSDELGWIDFARARVVGPPNVTLTVPATIVLGYSPPEALDTNPKFSDISWTVTGDVFSCTASTVCYDQSYNIVACAADAQWTGSKDPMAGGPESVRVRNTRVQYTLACTGPGGLGNDTTTVDVGCYDTTCDYATEICPSTLRLGVISSNECTRLCEVDNDCLRHKVQFQEVR